MRIVPVCEPNSRFGITPYADTSASFDITLTSRLNGRPLENIVVELNLGEGASGIKCVAARGTGGLGRGGVGAHDMGMNNNGASWSFDARKKVGQLQFILEGHDELKFDISYIDIKMGNS